ncbi:T9SS type A sorting domain-containing protein [Bacteroidota bacterium]
MRLAIFAFLFMVLSSGVKAQNPQSFMVIHCEPNNSNLFPELERLIEVADSAEIPLTIMFTPQWADLILADPVKVLKIRQWQINGHEIAAHHHGVEANYSWDGYTNLPPELWPDPSRYNGNMLDYIELMNQVAGDSLILSACIPPADDDWPPGILYRTEGHWAADAISQPVLQTVNGYDIVLIKHGVIINTTMVDSLIIIYNNDVRQIDIFGAVTHVQNFTDNENYLRQWFNFIKGKNCMTVRQIIRQRGIISSTENILDKIDAHTGNNLFQNYPNPFKNNTSIPFFLKCSSKVSINILDINGNFLKSVISGEFIKGYQIVDFIGTDLPSGNYILRLITPESVSSIKIIKN